MNDKPTDVVRYVLPTLQECLLPLLESNLSMMGIVDIVVVGYVHGLERWTGGGKWEEKNSDIDSHGQPDETGRNTSEIFAWQKFTSRKGYRIAFLGCRVSFWGDVAGNLVRALQRLNSAQCILYVGKLGSLRSEHAPNRWLATGCQSVVNGELVSWDNPLEKQLQRLKEEEQQVTSGKLGSEQAVNIAHGVHYTLGSVLDETKAWLTAVEKRYDFVDPEIGHMARASVEGGTDFGYLHIVSDNLARKYLYDLSNERLRNVLADRKIMVSNIELILDWFFDEWEPRKKVRTSKY